MKLIKDRYKETEIGLLPEGWEVASLGVIATLIDGDRGKNYPSPNEIVEEGILFLSTSNIQDNKLTFSTTKFITEEKFNRLGKGKILQKDLVITLRGTVGSVMIFETPEYETAFINAQMMIIRVREIIDYKYLFQTMISKVIKDQIMKISSGSAQPQLTKKDIVTIIVPLPPLPEQQRIAEILFATDAHLQKLDDIIADTQLLKKSMMKYLLTCGIGHTEFKDTEIGQIPKTWEVKKTEGILFNDKGAIKIGPFGSQLKKEYLTNVGYKVYGQENVFRNNFEIGNRCLSEERFKKLESCEVKPKDLLITMMGTIGKTAIVPEGIQTGIMDSHLIRLRVDNDKNLTEYIRHVFTSGIILKQIERLSVGGIMAGLSSAIIKKLIFPIPPLPEQHCIAEILSTIDDRIQLYENEKNDFILLKKGLMDKLLTGQIRVIK